MEHCLVAHSAPSMGLDIIAAQRRNWPLFSGFTQSCGGQTCSQWLVEIIQL